MKEDMKKLFGREMRYLLGLSWRQQLTLGWFVVSLLGSMILADTNVVAAVVAGVSAVVSGSWLKTFPEFEGE